MPRSEHQPSTQEKTPEIELSEINEKIAVFAETALALDEIKLLDELLELRDWLEEEIENPPQN